MKRPWSGENVVNYWRRWQKRESQTLQEVTLIRSICPPPARILDLGCGYGRHAILLSRQGYTVVGIDNSPDMISLGRQLALESGNEVDFRVGNVLDVDRVLDDVPLFDLAICMFSSIFFADDRQYQIWFEKVRRLLHARGRFLLDLTNRERFVRRWSPYPWKVIGNRETCILLIEEFDPIHGWAKITRVSLDFVAQVEEADSEMLRLFTFSEVSTLLKRAGFQVDWVAGDYDGSSFSVESPRMILMARNVGSGQLEGRDEFVRPDHLPDDHGS